VADINERLDRLQRREEFDRFGRPLRHAPAETPVGPPVARPAGVDDRLGEVLDAVASVVRRHPGLSVMIALADGRAGRPVIRVTERDGGVETGVVVVGTAQPRPVEPTPQPVEAHEATAGYGPYDGLSTPAAAPARESVPGSDPVFEPAFRDTLPTRDGSADDTLPSRDGLLGREGSLARDGLPSRDGLLGREGSLAARDGLPSREEGLSREGESRERGREDLQPGRGPARSAAANGRHAAAREQPARTGPSWHDALWSPESRDRFRQAEQDRQRTREERGPAAGAIPLPEDTSQVVSRLAQLLRDNPTLAASWSREAQE
jgi:hypothetical protein